MADSPVEVAQALARMAYGDPDRLGLYLADFDSGTLEAHHGLDGLRHPERYADELLTPDPVLTEPAC
jgi:hypothetical protein